MGNDVVWKSRITLGHEGREGEGRGDRGFLCQGTPPKFVSHAYGSSTSWDGVGGMFSLFVDVGRMRKLVDFFFLGWGGGLFAFSCRFSSLTRFRISFSLSFLSFSSFFSLSCLITSCSVNMVAYVVSIVLGWRGITG